MAPIRRFEDIEAWKRARELSRAIYRITRTGEFARDLGLREQIRRAGVSVIIAEGFERGGDKSFRQFLAMAKCSAGEVKSQLYVALDEEFITSAQFDELYPLATGAGRLAGGLMRYLIGSLRQPNANGTTRRRTRRSRTDS